MEETTLPQPDGLVAVEMPASNLFWRHLPGAYCASRHRGHGSERVFSNPGEVAPKTRATASSAESVELVVALNQERVGGGRSIRRRPSPSCILLGHFFSSATTAL